MAPHSTGWLIDHYSPLGDFLQNVEQLIAALLIPSPSTEESQSEGASPLHRRFIRRDGGAGEEGLYQMNLHPSSFIPHPFSDLDVLNDAGRYVLFGRAKRLRPALLLLAAAACNGDTNKAVEAAAAVEILHSASLVHDDIVDDAAWRRGKASARSVWGNKISVLLGDYLLCRSFAHLLQVKLPDILEGIIEVAQQMCHGQVTELVNVGPDLSEAAYLEVIAGKTASLFRFCGVQGAKCAPVSDAVAACLEDYAFNFGMAFQIADDIHDLIGTQEASGKPVNHDLRQHKITLPLIYALQQSQGETRDFLTNAMANPSLNDGQLTKMQALVAQSGGTDYAWTTCRQYLNKAHQSLQTLPHLLPQNGNEATLQQQAYETLQLTCTKEFPLPVMA